MITTTLPLNIVSEGNAREHHMARYKRRKMHREDTHWALKQFKRPRLPVIIELTRSGPNMMDAHDNLPMSMKAVVDGICDWLGVDDKDDRVRFLYGQVKGKHSVHVRIAEIRSDVPQCSTLTFDDPRMLAHA